MTSPAVGPARLRLFLVTQTISNIGSWATLIALWGVAQYRFDVGAAGVTALAVGWSLPAVVLAPAVGLAIDRLGPAKVLYAAQLLAIALLGLMIASSTFAQLAVLGTLSGVSKAFMDPAMLAIPPRLVDDAGLPRLNGALRMTHFLAIVIGPAIGGFAIDWLGFDGAFVVDIASFAVGILGLAVLPQHLLGPHPMERRPLRTQLTEGWRVVRASIVLRRLVLATTAISTLYGSYLVLEPLYVKRVLGRGASTYGWLQSVFGVTLVLAAMYVVRHANRLARLRVCALAAVISGLAGVTYLGSTSLAIAVIGVAAWGATTAFFSTPAATLLHRNAPGEAHGRVLAFERMIDAAIKLTGTLTAGALAAGIGIRPAAVVFAAISLALSLTALALSGTADESIATEPSLQPAGA